MFIKLLKHLKHNKNRPKIFGQKLWTEIYILKYIYFGPCPLSMVKREQVALAALLVTRPPSIDWARNILVKENENEF